MTLFEKVGYTKDTKFKVLVDYGKLVIGDIVTLAHDYGDDYSMFTTKDGRTSDMYLPGYSGVLKEELEVYEAPKELTPFKEAGYTKDTKFKVLVDYHRLKAGDVVTLDEDCGTESPWFKTGEGYRGEMYLPGMAPEECEEELEELVLYKESDTTLQQRVEALEKELKQLKEGILNACTK